MLTKRFEEAFGYATVVHADQVRKGTRIPYVSHLLLVTGTVLEHGGDEDEAIAALLHDTPEDKGGERRLADIRVRFGPRVGEIVHGCSDTFEFPKPPVAERRRKYLDHLRHVSDSSILLVSAADKLVNARAILRDLRTVGDAFSPGLMLDARALSRTTGSSQTSTSAGKFSSCQRMAVCSRASCTRWSTSSCRRPERSDAT